MWHNVEIIGYLGRDPEMRYTPDGQSVTRFSLAASRNWKSVEGEKRSQTIWFSVTAWGKMGEACNTYLQKGSKVFISGHFNPDQHGNPRIWSNKNGEPAASYEVTADDVRFLDSREDRPERSDLEYSDELSEDDIPF
ncbi:MAG: single-stranded DNA-binding protein [Anaerolineaceae bacterium]